MLIDNGKYSSGNSIKDKIKFSQKNTNNPKLSQMLPNRSIWSNWVQWGPKPAINKKNNEWWKYGVIELCNKDWWNNEMMFWCYDGILELINHGLME